MLPHLKRLELLLTELKRRQVFRAAAFYAVAAWAVIEVCSTVLPVLLLPDWILQAVVVLAVLGFPVTLVLAWAFDVTTRGVERTGEKEGREPAAAQFARSPQFRATLVLLVVVLTAAAGWTGWQLWLKPGSAGPQVGGEARVPLDPSSVAVLYFDDHSPGGDLAYLANGITEALIHELSQTDALQVVSRNGVKPYRDPDITIDSLARVLGTGSLVEGSVEGSGDRVSVTVQLIDGSTGMHRLSRRIDGQGEDLLDLRDRIVSQAVRLVGQNLGRELQRREFEAENQATQTDAWEAFQRAQHLREDADTLRWALGDTVGAGRALRRADSLLAEAAALDPEWVEPVVARGWVARNRAGLISVSQTSRDETLLRDGLGFAREALARSPGNPAALALKGTISVDLFRGSDAPEVDEALAQAAEADLREAVEADPEQVRAWVALAELLRLMGRFQEASVVAQHALDADPFLINAESEILFTLSQVWLDLGDVDRATEWADEGRRRFPSEVSFPTAKLVILAGRGEVIAGADTAYAVLETIEDLYGMPEWNLGRLLVAAVLAQQGMADSATAVADAVRASGARGAWSDYYEANLRIHLGQEDEALELLDRYLEIMPQRRAYIARDWWWEPLRSHPTFQEMVGVE